MGDVQVEEDSMIETVAATQSHRKYLPAAGRDVLLPFYDLIAKLLGADRARQTLLDQAALQPDARALDIGCGTGTFAVALKRRYPTVDIVGVDPDERALARAKRKAERAGVEVRFQRGFADSLEYPAATFEVVFSSFMFHHLEGDDRERTLREVRRVLKSEGAFYLLDFEVPHPESGHGFFGLFHSSERLRDNSESHILALLARAGFANVTKTGTRPVLFGLGRAGYYRASH
jgi:ubiquinone/menaquinone biosynthesis C-methylase UbiE